MQVYTLPAYEHDNRNYPVLYLLHGGGDTDDSWPTVRRAGAILDNLIAEYKAEPMIVVMPAGHIRATSNNCGLVRTPWVTTSSTRTLPGA